ncbi:hypothetical protein [Ochrobactrum sp. A-1]|uniref:hypothetical protein n=1 Tax=Ochrobactrum sp. A-1 TaxID=2920940 RepID=UPI001F0B018F|nr:hypothetical protein [Ochrobactrum sp. A-1]
MSTLSEAEWKLLEAGTPDIKTSASVFDVAKREGRSFFIYGLARSALARKGLVVAYSGGFYVLTAEGVEAVQDMKTSIVF